MHDTYICKNFYLKKNEWRSYIVPCVNLLLSSIPSPAAVDHLKRWHATPQELLWPEQHSDGSACRQWDQTCNKTFVKAEMKSQNLDQGSET